MMSTRKSDKCSKEKIQAFKLEVKQWCDSNKIPYKKITGLISYGGEVRLYRGLEEKSISLRYTSVYRDEWNHPQNIYDEKVAIIDFFK